MEFSENLKERAEFKHKTVIISEECKGIVVK